MEQQPHLAAPVANVETIAGGTGADAVTLANTLGTAMSVNLGTGANKLTLAAGGNTGSVTNVNTLVGGTGADAVTLANALGTAMSVSLGTGANKLTLAAGGNVGSVSNVNTLVGGTGDDTITLNTAVTNGSIDLGAGNDTLTFANGSNAATLANVETAIGGTGSDTFVLTGTTASTVIGGGGINFITGNSGADTFVFDQNGTGNSTIMNFSAARGDLIGLDTTGSSTLTNNPFDLGGVSLTNSVDIAMVADNAALLAKTLSNGSKGGFAYEQDTGGLYYSGTGHFSGGGTLVGIVTSNGTTPWAYDATRFVEV